MRYDLRISLVFALALLANSGFALAQGDGTFNRVTTAGVRRGAPTSISRTASVARTDAGQRGVSSMASDDSLRPYSNRPTVRGEISTKGVPRFSAQPEQPVATREVIPQPQSRNYFPGMRASRAIQQPVTLTARVTGVRHICTPSRAQTIGAGGAHR